MQQDADFITADFLYMFRGSIAHLQEYKILTRQPPVQVVMVAGGYSLRHNMTEWWAICNHNYLYLWLPFQYFVLLMMGAWRPKHVQKVYSNKIYTLLHHVGVLFNLNKHLIVASRWSSRFIFGHRIIAFIRPHCVTFICQGTLVVMYHFYLPKRHTETSSWLSEIRWTALFWISK